MSSVPNIFRKIPSFSELILSCPKPKRFTGHFAFPQIFTTDGQSCEWARHSTSPTVLGETSLVTPNFQSPRSGPRTEMFCPPIENLPVTTQDRKTLDQLKSLPGSNKTLQGDSAQLDNHLEGNDPEHWPRDNLEKIAEHFQKVPKILDAARVPTVQTPKRKSPGKRKTKVKKAESSNFGTVSFTVNPIDVQFQHTDICPTFPDKFLNKDLSIRNSILCDHCGSKLTPEWRSGPSGCRTLCNACGLFLAKLTKKFGVEEASIKFLNLKRTGKILDRRIGAH